jgi:hypothetical protein
VNSGIVRYRRTGIASRFASNFARDVNGKTTPPIVLPKLRDRTERLCHSLRGHRKKRASLVEMLASIEKIPDIVANVGESLTVAARPHVEKSNRAA